MVLCFIVVSEITIILLRFTIKTSYSCYHLILPIINSHQNYPERQIEYLRTT
jgi:hypothetical protein